MTNTTADRAALQQLEQTLHREIPLTRAMGVTVVRLDAHGLVLRAPLAPNLNHKHTAFGGSLATLATLAGWGLVQVLLREQAPVTVVIQDSTVDYRHPVTADFEAVAPWPAAADRTRFLATLARTGRARIALDVQIRAGDKLAVQFHGRFVAVDRRRYPDSAPASPETAYSAVPPGPSGP